MDTPVPYTPAAPAPGFTAAKAAAAWCCIVGMSVRVCVCVWQLHVETHGREPTPAMPCGFVVLQLVMVSNVVSS